MEKEFQDIIDAHNGIIYKVGRSFALQEDDFNDLYQEILIKIWKNLDRFRGESKVSTWIYRIALNTAITHDRKKKKAPLALSDNIARTMRDGSLASQQLKEDQDERVGLLYRCIQMLKAEQRAIVLLHLDGNNYEEISEVLGISVNNVGVKLTRLRKKLQQLLKEQGYERI